MIQFMRVDINIRIKKHVGPFWKSKLSHYCPVASTDLCVCVREGGGVKSSGIQEHAPLENFEMSHLLEYYCLHCQAEQLKTYFMKKSSYRYANYLSLAERKMTILNMEKYFSFMQQMSFMSAEHTWFRHQGSREKFVCSASLFLDLWALSDQRIFLHIYVLDRNSGDYWGDFDYCDSIAIVGSTTVNLRI